MMMVVSELWEGRVEVVLANLHHDADFCAQYIAERVYCGVVVEKRMLWHSELEGSRARLPRALVDGGPAGMSKLKRRSVRGV